MAAAIDGFGFSSVHEVSAQAAASQAFRDKQELREEPLKSCVAP